MTAGKISELSRPQLEELMTVAQYVTDLCLNELEARGELRSYAGMLIVPYVWNMQWIRIRTRRTH